MTKANEEWRHDQERRQAAADAYRRWQDAGARALALARSAKAELRPLRLFLEDDPTAKMLDQAESFLMRAVDRLEAVVRDDPEPNETRVGNMAAFGTPRVQPTVDATASSPSGTVET